MQEGKKKEKQKKIRWLTGPLRFKILSHLDLFFPLGGGVTNYKDVLRLKDFNIFMRTIFLMMLNC